MRRPLSQVTKGNLICQINPHFRLSFPVINNLPLTKTQERPSSRNKRPVFCKNMGIVTNKERLRYYQMRADKEDGRKTQTRVLAGTAG